MSLSEDILEKYSFECLQCDENRSTWLIHESNLPIIINKVLDTAMAGLDGIDQIMIDIGEHANPPQQAAVMFADVVEMLEALKDGIRG